MSLEMDYSATLQIKNQAQMYSKEEESWLCQNIRIFFGSVDTLPINGLTALQVLCTSQK